MNKILELKANVPKELLDKVSKSVGVAYNSPIENLNVGLMAAALPNVLDHTIQANLITKQTLSEHNCVENEILDMENYQGNAVVNYTMIP